jgi:plastocyanin
MKRVLLLLAVVLVAGCGSDSNNNQAASGTTSGGGGGGGGSVELTATEFKFDPSSVRVDTAGSTTITLVNDGKFGHALELEGQGIEEKTDTIDGGKTAELTVDLKPGEYEFYCPVGDHRKKGMEGTLVVGGAAGGMGTTTEETDTTESSGYGS